jgi:nucleotide-binding universal stress UspA family protein
MIVAKVPHSIATPTANLHPSTKFSSISPMRPMENILVALDFSSPSAPIIRAATRFADVLCANLFVAHIFEYSDAGARATGGIVEGLTELRQKTARRLDEIVRRIHRKSMVAQAVMRDGLAARTILEIIEDDNIDLAILGTKNYTGLERFVFGSTAEAVFRRASCPLLIVGPEAYVDRAVHPQAPIVFATDLNPRFSHAIQCAAFLCKAFGAPLHCIEVLPASTNTPGAPIISEVMKEVLRNLTEENGLDETPVCSIAYGDDISEAVVKYAKDHKAQLIVLRVQRTSTLASHLPAHITYRIVAGASCPVLTVSS